MEEVEIIFKGDRRKFLASFDHDHTGGYPYANVKSAPARTAWNLARGTATGGISRTDDCKPALRKKAITSFILHGN